MPALCHNYANMMAIHGTSIKTPFVLTPFGSIIIITMIIIIIVITININY